MKIYYLLLREKFMQESFPTEENSPIFHESAERSKVSSSESHLSVQVETDEEREGRRAVVKKKIKEMLEEKELPPEQQESKIRNRILQDIEDIKKTLQEASSIEPLKEQITDSHDPLFTENQDGEFEKEFLDSHFGEDWTSFHCDAEKEDVQESIEKWREAEERVKHHKESIANRIQQWKADSSQRGDTSA
jgi:hypothetical protein